MDIMMPLWVFNTIIVIYVLFLAVLLYMVVLNKKRMNTGQILLMAFALLAVPVVGPVIVAVITLRKRKVT
ncbi:MAG: hypothetical protein ABIN89_03090 [Chitinophagaceae bacterium]